MTAKLIRLAAAAGIGMSLLHALSASAQGTITLNTGPACSYTSFTQTVTASGLPTFAFNGVSGSCTGSNTGGPNIIAQRGTARFEATTAPSSDVGGPVKTINITRDGHISGANLSISGSVVVNTQLSVASCTTTPLVAATFSMPDGVTLATVNVNPGNTPGLCVLDLNADSLGSITRMGFDVVSPNTMGTIQFAAPTTINSNPGQTVTINGSRTGAGGATAASMGYSCTVTSATPAGSYTLSPATITGDFLFNPGVTAQSFQLALPAFSNGTTAATVTCLPGGVGGNPSAPTVTPGTQVLINVAPIAPPTCAPTASPSSAMQGSATTVTLASNCTGGTVNGWEWEAVTANAPALSATNVQNPTVSVLTTTPSGTYTYRVRGNNGTLGSFTNVNVTVSAIQPPTCVPTASPSTINQGTATTVNLSSSCTGGTVSAWEWEAVTANAPALSATNVANPTVSVLTTTAAGSYQYRVRANNGAQGAFANVTISVQTQVAGCTIRSADEFPAWAPSPSGTGDTTNSPLVSIAAGSTLSFKLPYSQNYAFVPRDNTPLPSPGTFWGFFVNPNSPTPTTGQVIAYLAVGEPYVLSISNAPCEFVPHTVVNPGSGNASITVDEPRNGRCIRPILSQTSLVFHRNDSTVTNAQFDATGGQACRLPLPDANGFLYVNLKPIGPASPTPAAGCTSGYCVQILPRSD